MHLAAMGFFTSFIHNEALAEILIEGHNPYAQQKLDAADLDALRQHLHTSDEFRAYVIGRIVGGGRGVWALSGKALLILDATRRTVQRVDLQQVQSFEAERGRFGHSVRLQAQGQGWSLYGVDRQFAGLMHQGLQASGVASRFDDRPARSPVWREPAPAGWVADCLGDAQRRLAMA